MTRPTQPAIIFGYGATDEQHDVRLATIEERAFYRDLSTIVIVPSIGSLPDRVYESHMSMIFPPNQKRVLMVASRFEVGYAYNAIIQMCLDHPDLSKWRYVLTLEHDNLVPPTAVVDLLSAAAHGEWDVLGALYWTKGEQGVPQMWGDASHPVENYWPQLPNVAGGIVPVNATGMGFTLWKLDVFRRLAGPWFATQDGGTVPESLSAQAGSGVWTQDLWFFHRAREAGLNLKVGVHCGIRVGHLDVETGVVW